MGSEVSGVTSALPCVRGAGLQSMAKVGASETKPGEACSPSSLPAAANVVGVSTCCPTSSTSWAWVGRTPRCRSRSAPSSSLLSRNSRSPTYARVMPRPFTISVSMRSLSESLNSMARSQYITRSGSLVMAPVWLAAFLGEAKAACPA